MRRLIQYCVISPLMSLDKFAMRICAFGCEVGLCVQQPQHASLLFVWINILFTLLFNKKSNRIFWRNWNLSIKLCEIDYKLQSLTWAFRYRVLPYTTWRLRTAKYLPYTQDSLYNKRSEDFVHLMFALTIAWMDFL